MREEKLGAPGRQAAMEGHQFKLLLGRERYPVLGGELVERAGEGALHAGAVVAPDPDDEGVVELPHLIEGVEEPAHVPVGVLLVPGVHLHLPGIEPLLVLGEGVPRREGAVVRCRTLRVRRRGGQLRLRGDNAQLPLSPEGLDPVLVPPAVEAARAFVAPLPRNLMWGVGAAGGVVHKERFFGVLGPHAL